jgi:hypothetical protein
MNHFSSICILLELLFVSVNSNRTITPIIRLALCRDSYILALLLRQKIDTQRDLVACHVTGGHPRGGPCGGVMIAPFEAFGI